MVVAVVETPRSIVAVGFAVSDADAADLTVAVSLDGGQSWAWTETLSEAGKQIPRSAVVYGEKIIIAGYEIAPETLAAEQNITKAALWQVGLGGTVLERVAVGASLDGVTPRIESLAVSGAELLAVGLDETVADAAGNRYGFLVVWRSADGITWSREQAATAGLQEVLVYDAAVAADGTVYICGQYNLPEPTDVQFDALLMSSRDFGRSWQMIDAAALTIPWDQALRRITVAGDTVVADGWDERVEEGESMTMTVVAQGGVVSVAAVEQPDHYLLAVGDLGGTAVAVVRVGDGTVALADVGSGGPVVRAGSEVTLPGTVDVGDLVRTAQRDVLVGRYTDASGGVDIVIWTSPIA